jgi:hypothetical protein
MNELSSIEAVGARCIVPLQASGISGYISEIRIFCSDTWLTMRRNEKGRAIPLALPFLQSYFIDMALRDYVPKCYAGQYCETRRGLLRNEK